MLRFVDFYADRRQTDNRQQTTDKPIALPPAAHARTRGNNQIKWNEIVPWILVAVMSVLLIVSLVIHMIQAVSTHRLRGSADRNLNTPPDCTLAIASNPCYEASDVKLYSEVQEAVHLYETLKQ